MHCLQFNYNVQHWNYSNEFQKKSPFESGEMC